MKRSPLKRYRPLYQRTPLRPGRKQLQHRTPLRPRSRKLSRLYKVRRALVERILEQRPLCQRCFMARSTEVHEVVTRARGGPIIDEDNCRALCWDCHRWVHDHPGQATQQGWLARRRAA